MSERTDQAIAKITNEMMQLKDPIAQGVEEHLTDICTNDIIAEKILTADKTVKGACDALWGEAEKRRKGNSAYIPMEEAFLIIEKCFGITEEDKAPPASDSDIIDFMSMF